MMSPLFPRAAAAAFLLAVATRAPAQERSLVQEPALQTAAMLPVRGRVEGGDVVRSARRFLGVRYVLGGTTPRAFDCSGFVRYVFAEYGIALPRTAREQAGVGIAPFPGELEPGDLLFFYGGRGAQHIAMYVGGDTIIHASSSAGRVRLDRLARRGSERSWFNRRLIAVRRVLPADGVFYVPGGVAAAAPARAVDIVVAATGRGADASPR
jgi:cell wall-associated NlpC family hydrolase